MGTWGCRIYENDTFCEIVELFRDLIREGLPVEDIIIKIQQEYENEDDSCIATLAIAEGLWRLGRLSCKDLENVQRIVDDETTCKFWMHLGADEKFIQKWRLSLDDFLKRISLAPTESQKWRINPIEQILRKGTCFWYKHRGNIYGAIVLERIKSSTNYYLIAITENLDSIPTVLQLYAASVYTVAWFGDVNLLEKKRIHVIGDVNVPRNYINKYGIRFISGRSVYISNCGQLRTWTHSFRRIQFDKVRMEDFIYYN